MLGKGGRMKSFFVEYVRSYSNYDVVYLRVYESIADELGSLGRYFVCRPHGSIRPLISKYPDRVYCHSVVREA
jgi:hypothetical protein